MNTLVAGGGTVTTVATPSISGTTPFGASSTATITCDTSGATIHYTTNGSTPTSASSTYATPLSITSTTTVKAIGMKSGSIDSAVATKTYTQIAYGNVYYGTSVNTTLTDVQIAALTAVASQITPGASYVFTPTGEQYFYLCWPDTLTYQPIATTGFVSGGLAMGGDFANTGTYSNTANGWPYAIVSVSGVNYRVYRLLYTNSSPATIVVTAA